MEIKVVVKDTTIPHGVRQIAEQLPDASEVGSGDKVSVVFSGRDFIYLTGLTMLAAWRKSLPANVSVHVDDVACQDNARSFLTNTGFREIMDTGHERPSARGRVGKIPLQPITNRLTKEATVAEITEIFDEFTGQVEDTNPFKTMISELTENVLAHSEAIAPGYACARVLGGDSNQRAEICIADTGIGIRESFLRGTNDEVIERVRRGASPLEIAVEGLNSSKPRSRLGSATTEYFGFGLLVTRRLVEENRGWMTIISGDQELIINRFGPKSQTLSRDYQGTFIGIVLDLANPLPLEDIYQEATDKLVPSPPSPSIVEASSRSVSASIDAPSVRESKMELRHYGTELLTRESGVIIRADLATRLARGDRVSILLDEISDITPSVADEAFGKLAEGIGFDDFSKRVSLEGGTQLIQRLIDFVVKTRSSRSR